MALIKCPDCGKEISDKAKKCPNCAYSLEKNKKGIIIAFSIIMLLVIGLIIFYIYNQNTYNKKVSLFSASILRSSANCESLANLTSEVWYNTIYKQDDKETNKYTINSIYYKDTDYYKYKDYQFNEDFNTSLLGLFNDKKEEISKIEKESEDIKNKIKELRKTPFVQKELYNALMDFYNTYQELVKISISPSGSYTDYTKNKNEKIENCLTAYERLTTLLPNN